MKHAALALAALLALAPAAQAQGPFVEVRNAWIRVPPNGMSSTSAYLDAVNGGNAPDRLVGASCPCAARVVVHQMSMAGGVMRMGEAPGGLAVQPAGTLRLQPGGNHLMLMGVRPLRAGQRVPLTLQFARAGRMTVEADVRP